jgi:hypothetical protein
MCIKTYQDFVKSTLRQGEMLKPKTMPQKLITNSELNIQIAFLVRAPGGNIDERPIEKNLPKANFALDQMIQHNIHQFGCVRWLLPWRCRRETGIRQ